MHIAIPLKANLITILRNKLRRINKFKNKINKNKMKRNKTIIIQPKVVKLNKLIKQLIQPKVVK